MLLLITSMSMGDDRVKSAVTMTAPGEGKGRGEEGI
jgi:hypothetical protein